MFLYILTATIIGTIVVTIVVPTRRLYLAQNNGLLDWLMWIEGLVGFLFGLYLISLFIVLGFLGLIYVIIGLAIIVWGTILLASVAGHWHINAPRRLLFLHAITAGTAFLLFVVLGPLTLFNDAWFLAPLGVMSISLSLLLFSR
jgi:hypothetical protein